MLSESKLKGTFVIANDKGLHTRPATELVKCAQVFKSQIYLGYRGIIVNAKSVLGVLMLAAAKGAKISVEAEGQDAEEAVIAILHLAHNGFDVKY